jgi:hypothetical protein
MVMDLNGKSRNGIVISGKAYPLRRMDALDAKAGEESTGNGDRASRGGWHTIGSRGRWGDGL